MHRAGKPLSQALLAEAARQEAAERARGFVADHVDEAGAGRPAWHYDGAPDTSTTGRRYSQLNDALTDALRHMFWDTLVPDRDELESDLASVVPEGAGAVCRVLLHDDSEVAGIFTQGLAARFDHGPAFVRWDEIERYTRVPVPGAAFHLLTAKGNHSMSDPRLRDVGALLDVIYGRVPVNRPDEAPDEA